MAEICAAEGENIKTPDDNPSNAGVRCNTVVMQVFLTIEQIGEEPSLTMNGRVLER